MLLPMWVGSFFFFFFLKRWLLLMTESIATQLMGGGLLSETEVLNRGKGGGQTEQSSEGEPISGAHISKAMGNVL